MNRFRKVIFWCHLAAGVFAGIVVLIMSVTGVLLTYEKQVTLWADTRNYHIPATAPATRLPIDDLVSSAREAKPAVRPTAITFRSDLSYPTAVTFGREGSIFVNPYTGEVLGDGSKRTRSFFQVVTNIHRRLGAEGGTRAVGRAVTGICNLAFLFLIMSGLYLWMPRVWVSKQLRNTMWFRRGLSGRARDFNWHNVIGFWSLIPLFIIVLSALPISYTWAGNLAYRIVGETPPPTPPSPPLSPPNAAPTQGSGLQSGTPSQLRSSSISSGGETGNSATDAGNFVGRADRADGLDTLLHRAEQQTAGWRSISLQLPTSASAPVTFTIDKGTGGQPQKRAQLTLDRTNGGVVRYEPYSSYSPGRQLRTFLRFAHTGEVAGFIGQSIAGLASLGGAFLVWTGLSLSWRRLRAWRARRVVPARGFIVERARQ